MGLNLFGLGFSFGAKDDGLSAMQEKARLGFENIGESMKTVTGFARNFTNEGMNLTTSLEAQRVSAATTGVRMAGAFGKTGEEARKVARQVASLSERLNMMPEDAAKSILEFGRSVDEMKAIGLGTYTDLAKAARQLGFDHTKFGNVVRRLRSDFKLTAEQMNSVMGAALSVGKATGDVSKTLDSLSSMTNLLSRAQAAGTTDIAGYAKSILALDKAFFAITQDQGRAREFSRQWTDNLLAVKENFRNLLAGAVDSIEGMDKETAILTGRIVQDFKESAKGPTEFMASMGRLVRELKAKGKDTTHVMDFIRSRLSKIVKDPRMVEPVMKVMAGLTDEATEGLMKTTDAASEFSKVVKDDRTGRTLADNMKLLEDQFEANIRAMGGTDSSLLKLTRKSFREFEKTIKKYTKKDGYLGAMARGLIRIQREGLVGVLPERMKGFGIALGNVVKHAAPAVDLLGKLGFRLSDLLNPTNLLFGLFTGTALSLATQGPNATAEALDGFINSTIDGFGRMLDRSGTFIDDFVTMWDSVEASLLSAWDRNKTTIMGAIDRFWEGAKGTFEDGWRGFKEGMIPQSMEGTQSDPLATRIGKSLGRIWERAISIGRDRVVPALGKLFDDFVKSEPFLKSMDYMALAMHGALSKVFTGWLGKKLLGEGPNMSVAPPTPIAPAKPALGAGRAGAMDKVASLQAENNDLLKLNIEANKESASEAKKTREVIQSNGLNYTPADPNMTSVSGDDGTSSYLQ